jgi:calcineurin-like phosphoesterase family protein
MRIAFVTDVHFGPEAWFEGKLRKLSHQAERLTREFVRTMNEVERPDLVVNLGDVIEDQNRELDLERYGRFVEVLSELQAPVLHVAGNHDSVNLSDDELRGLWRHEGPLYYSRAFAEVHVAVLRSIEHKDVAVHLPSEQLDWLASDLAAAKAPAIVLVHHPLSEMDLAGNRWFERAPHICRVAERRAARRVIEQSGKVVCVINGHVHWNHLDVIAGIPYVTLQSLIENLDEDAPGRPAAAWAVCDVERRRVSVRISGAETARYQFEP